MAKDQASPTRGQTPSRGPMIRDFWELIIKIILIILLIAWFLQECSKGETNPFALLILLLALALLIALIWRQRHFIQLHCSLTGPTGCVRGATNILAGKILEPVIGAAWGPGFSHYLIEVRDPGGDLQTGVVIYRDGGGNPDPALTQGNFAVNPGTLAWIDVEKAAVDAGADLLTSTTFGVRLRVFATDGSELAPPCNISFTLSVNEVYIKRVSTPWSHSFASPNEPLRVADDAISALATVGGSMHVRGAANVYGCTSEKIQEYTIWAIPDNGFAFVQPLPFTAVVPAPGWVQLTHIVFAPQVVDGTNYSADDVRALNILDGNPQPDILTNIWGVRTECACVLVDLMIVCNCWHVPSLNPSAFNSNGLPKLNPALHEGGTGKFTFLLQVIDTNGDQFYDIQRVWVDNEPIHAAITGIAGLPPCADLYTKTHANAFKTVNIQGTAWDQLINPADPTQPTSDNFHHFTVHFKKQGAAGMVQLIDSPTPIPARPNPVGVGILTPWNLQSLDKPSNPLAAPLDQLLDPGEECTYNVILQTNDHTIVNEGTVHSSGLILFPIKIINGPEP
jgi:hypothetical protein